MRLVLTVVGAYIGWQFGGATGAKYGAQIGSSIGATIGSEIGAALFPNNTAVSGPRLGETRIQDSSYGAPIANIYGGAIRTSGNVIWALPLEERASTQTSGGKGGGDTVSVTSYSYYGHFAIGICEGPVSGIRKVWADGKLIYDVSTGNVAAAQYFRFYAGTETQMPDSHIEAHEGVGSTPAYRGLAYIVFEAFPLADFANRIPEFSFEVIKQGSGVFSSSQIGHWDNPTSLDSFFSAPYLTGGTVPVVSWGYYTGYLDLVWADIVPNAGVTVRREFLPSPGWGFPVVGHADEPGVLYIGDDSQLAWMDASNVIYQTTIPHVGANNLGGSFCKEGDIIWASSTYAAGDYPIYRYDLQTASVITYPGDWFDELIRGDTPPDLLTVSADQSPFTILGVTADYLYVANSDTNSVERRDKTTLAFIENVATSPYLGGDSTGYVLSDDLIYTASGGGGVTKIKDGVVTHLSIPLWGGVGSFAAIGEDIFVWTDTTLGSEINVYFAAAAGIGATPLSEVVTELCSRAGLSPADIDVSELTTDTVDGYIVARRTSIRACIEPLASVYAFDGVETDHTVRFPKRSRASIRTIQADDLAAYDGGDEPPPYVTGERGSDLELPVRVDVNYLRRESDYQTSGQFATRETAPGDGQVSLELPLVLSDAQARNVAQTQMMQVWMGRQKAAWATTRKHLDIEPTDIITLPLAAGWTPVRVLKKDESRNGLVKFEGEVFDQSTLTGFGDSVFGGPAGQVISGTVPGVVPPTNSLLADLPALREEDDTAGYYWIASGTTGWPGAVLFRSVDSGATYGEMAGITQPATMGTVTGTLAAGPTHVLDEGNTVTVTLLHGELSSITRDALMNGGNACLIGSEILQFRTATLTGTNTYVLSGLLRGLRGTESAVGTHVASESFVLLQPVGIYRLGAQLSDLGITRPYKTVTSGGTLSTANPVGFTPAGRALKPFSPVQLAGGRDAAGNLALSWRRRNRLSGEMRDSFDIPMSESSEAYEVEIWNSSFTILKRTITGLSAAATTYSAAQQTTDFGSPQSTVHVRIYQLSATVGRGEALQGTI